jgi:uncharacterized damage-inducible protein DinB
MVQRGNRARLALHALLQLGRGRKVRSKNFNRDGPIQAGVSGPVHFSHPAASKRRLDFIGAKFTARGKGHPSMSLYMAQEFSPRCLDKWPSLRNFAILGYNDVRGKCMKMIEMFKAQLEDEAGRTRRALERMPEGQDDWKPHEKSMPLGRLAMLVARMPSWLDLVINRDELDLHPPGGSNISQVPLRTPAELVKALDQGVAAAGEALATTSEEHLLKPWRLLVSGRVVSEQPRHIVVRDTFMHLAHHRGQLTVYLRLRNQPVPAIYGPSADEATFA